MFHHTIIVLSLLLWIHHITTTSGAVMRLDLQLPVQAVPITTKGVSLTPAHGEDVVDTTLCEKVC